MDETEYEDGETEGGALSAASPFETREQYLAAYGQAVEGQRRAAQEEARTRQKAYEQAQRYIEQNSFGRPTQSEQLMRLSQALLSPRRSRGFGATLANVVPALAENQQLARRAEEQRAEALMRLQQEYATGTAAARSAAARGEVEALQPLAPNFRPVAPPRGTLNQTTNTFAYPDRPNPAGDVFITGDGRRLPVFTLPNGMRGVQTEYNGEIVYTDEAGNILARARDFQQ